MTNIYHITPRRDWEAARQVGSYRAASLEREGFIHLSTPEQVVGTANRYYRGQRDLVLLAVDPARLDAELRYEPSAEAPASSGRFPHLYGALNLAAVAAVLDFPPDADDGWSGLPPYNPPK